ncbi:MAG TPA: GTPase Era [bacterium]|nr:GTPase Era [bacterium]
MIQIQQIDVKNFKSGYVALIGKPNVGKSTLMNALLGQQLSIVTAKPQTTRQQVLGILSGDNFQMIFLDTPGLLVPRYKLQDKMVKAAQRAIGEADIILFLVEPEDKIDEFQDQIMREIIINAGKKTLLVINKIDSIVRDTILPIIARYDNNYRLTEIFPISALFGDGVEDVKQSLIKHLPTGMPFYPPDQITDQPERFFVSELIRQKIFENYGEEIPYSTAVTIEDFKEREGAKDFIRANIILERNSQKGILIGKKGAALKKIGKLSREEIERFLGRPVFLELFVKVRHKWRQNESFLREFGYN